VVWPLALFIVTFILGILAVLGGVGGGVLFVPIVGGFFPFNIDFVRGAGLLVAWQGRLLRDRAFSRGPCEHSPGASRCADCVVRCDRRAMIGLALNLMWSTYSLARRSCSSWPSWRLPRNRIPDRAEA